MFLSIALAICTVLLCVVWLLKRHYGYWKALGAPYIKPSLLWGNMKGVGSSEHMAYRMKKFYSEYKNKTPFVGIYMFVRPAALICDLDLVKRVLITDFQYFHDRGVYFNEKNDPISAHLFSIYGPKWKLLRSKLTPTFTSGKMKFMYPTITEVGDRLQTRLGQLTEISAEIEMKNIFARYTTDVIGSCAFGLECNSLNDKNAEFRKMGQSIFETPRHSQAAMFFLASIRGLAQKLGIKMFSDDVSEFFTNAIKETEQHRNSNNITRKDFIDILREMRKRDDEQKITFDEMVAQAFIFFVAGFETSSTLLTFVSYELATNVDIQEKLRDHINEVLEKHQGKFTYEAMMDMTYLDQVLNEGLRMYPPLTSLFRVCKKDYKVPESNLLIKKNTMVVLPIFAIQRDPDLYSNPDQFNPENFSQENMNSRKPETFLSFGDGPRVCIGLRFGMMQARIALVSILRKYKFTLSAKMNSQCIISPQQIIIAPESGMWLNVKPLK